MRKIEIPDIDLLTSDQEKELIGALNALNVEFEIWVTRKTREERGGL